MLHTVDLLLNLCVKSQMVQTERYQKELVSGTEFNSCDTYAVAAAIDDTLLTESEQVTFDTF